jgi:hypothetical protein
MARSLFLRDLLVELLALPLNSQGISFLLEDLEGSYQDIAVLLHTHLPTTVIQTMILPMKIPPTLLDSNATL